MTKEEFTKLLIESYDRGVEDAKQEALAALEKTVAVMVAAQLAQQEHVGWWDDKLGFFAEKHFDQLQPIYKFPQAQQEPVAWGVDWGKAGDTPCVSIIKRLPGGGIEVVAVEYGPQRTWVGLTDEGIWLEYQNFWPFHPAEEPTLAKDIAKFARAIEAKLKEKNT